VFRETFSVTSIRSPVSSGDCVGSISRSVTTEVSITLNSAGSPALITDLLSDSGM